MSFFEKFSRRSVSTNMMPELVSIIENMNNILNTKQDYGSPLKDFGIRDLNEYTSRKFITDAVLEEVKRNIELYEPRVELIGISIEDADDAFNLSFKVECNIRQNHRSMRMKFDAVMNNFQVDNW